MRLRLHSVEHGIVVDEHGMAFADCNANHKTSEEIYEAALLIVNSINNLETLTNENKHLIFNNKVLQEKTDSLIQMVKNLTNLVSDLRVSIEGDSY